MLLQHVALLLLLVVGSTPAVTAIGPIADSIRAGEMPGRIWVYSNYHCNLACGYCLTESSPKSVRRELDHDTMVEIARRPTPDMIDARDSRPT